MVITDYSQKKHPGGYTGIRVTGTLDGKQIQKYFKNNEQGRAEAQALNARVMTQSDHRRAGIAKRHTQQYNYSKSARYDPPRRTSIVGITMALQAQNKCTPPRHYPVFLIAHQDKEQGIANVTSRAITRNRNLEATWREACQLLAQWRGYKRVPKGWYNQCPEAEAFKKLRRYYNKRGEKILLSNLDVFK